MRRGIAIIFSWGPRWNYHILFGIKKLKKKKKNSNYDIPTYIEH